MSTALFTVSRENKLRLTAFSRILNTAEHYCPLFHTEEFTKALFYQVIVEDFVAVSTHFFKVVFMEGAGGITSDEI